MFAGWVVLVVTRWAADPEIALHGGRVYLAGHRRLAVDVRARDDRIGDFERFTVPNSLGDHKVGLV